MQQKKQENLELVIPTTRSSHRLTQITDLINTEKHLLCSSSSIYVNLWFLWFLSRFLCL